jgi:hypothetical protein
MITEFCLREIAGGLGDFVQGISLGIPDLVRE